MAATKRQRREPGGGSVYQQRGRWIAQVHARGVTHRQYLGTREEAERAREQMRESLQLGFEPTRQTVQQFLEGWLARRTPGWSPSTLRGYREKLRNYVYPLIGRVRLRNLTPGDVQDVLDAIIRSGRSPSTAHSTRRILSSALERAAREGLILRNVAKLTDPPTIARAERRALNAEQVIQLADAMRGHRLEAVVLLGVLGGLRQGEVLALAWRDVDLERGTVHVHQGLHRVEGEDGARRYVIRDRPKTAKSDRAIPLPAIAIEALRARRSRQLQDRLRAGEEWQSRDAEGVDPDLVFTTDRGRPLNGGTVTHELQRVLEDAGLPRVTFHELRHTYASRMVAEGVAPSVLSRILGHARIQTTLEFYVHVADDATAAAVDRLEASLAAARGRVDARR